MHGLIADNAPCWQHGREVGRATHTGVVATVQGCLAGPSQVAAGGGALPAAKPARFKLAARLPVVWRLGHLSLHRRRLVWLQQRHRLRHIDPQDGAVCLPVPAGRVASAVTVPQ